MKRIFLALVIALGGVNAVGVSPVVALPVYDQKKPDDKRKEPTPPVVKPKTTPEKPKDPPPRKDKKPD